MESIYIPFNGYGCSSSQYVDMQMRHRLLVIIGASILHSRFDNCLQQMDIQPCFDKKFNQMDLVK
jgi:hypothetical protein